MPQSSRHVVYTTKKRDATSSSETSVATTPGNVTSHNIPIFIFTSNVAKFHFDSVLVTAYALHEVEIKHSGILL